MVGIAEVNGWELDQFVARLGPLFEGSSWVAQRAWSARPFRDLQHLHATLCAVLDASADEEKLALIRAHPDLAGRAALAGSLGAESAAEQAAAGVDRLTPTEVESFTRLNQAYRSKFGFPFVVCARENRKQAILDGFAARLPNPRPVEVERALAEVARIAWHRLCDVLGA
jgi:2-oxo-4-hydroxy-4-carboxy-5-ureidoimidazoline decarboxylase